jgi:hypothetical protein
MRIGALADTVPISEEEADRIVARIRRLAESGA